jgi:hypothetical protein
MVADQSSTDHGGVRARRAQRVCEPHAVPRGSTPYAATPRVVLSLPPRGVETRRQTHPTAFLGRFSSLLEAEYISDVADACLRTLAK